MASLNINEEQSEFEYNFEKQKNEALKQFDKLYSNLQNKNKHESTENRKKNTSNTQKNFSKKIKAKFKKNDIPSFMDIFFKDQDKTLLIILIIMLMDNEENLIIIMILIYLLV